MRGEAAAAAKRELEAGRAALARGRDDLLQSQRDLAQAQACPRLCTDADHKLSPASVTPEAPL